MQDVYIGYHPSSYIPLISHRSVTAAGSVQHADHPGPEPGSLETEAVHGVHFAICLGRCQAHGQGQPATTPPLGAWAGRLWQIGGDESGRPHATTERAGRGAGSTDRCSCLQHQRDHLAFKFAATGTEPELW